MIDVVVYRGGQPWAEPALGLIMTMALDTTNDPVLAILQQCCNNTWQRQLADKALLAAVRVKAGSAALPEP